MPRSSSKITFLSTPNIFFSKCSSLLYWFQIISNFISHIFIWWFSGNFIWNFIKEYLNILSSKGNSFFAVWNQDQASRRLLLSDDQCHVWSRPCCAPILNLFLLQLRIFFHLSLIFNFPWSTPLVLKLLLLVIHTQDPLIFLGTKYRSPRWVPLTLLNFHIIR